MRKFAKPVVVSSVLGLSAAVLLLGATPASAAVRLATTNAYVVLAGSTVTNTGPSVLNGDLGLSPGTAVTGFPPGIVNGVQNVANAAADQAKTDLITAYNDIAGSGPVTRPTPADLGGQNLGPGVYKPAGGSAGVGLTGTLTLNGGNDPNALFIFQAPVALTTATSSRVALIGVNPCNVYWYTGSSATLGTGSVFVGTLIALSSITATTGARITGRLLARNGAVTLDTNTINKPVCQLTTTVVTPPASSAPPGGGTTSSAPAGGTTSSAPGGGGKTSTPAGGGKTTTGAGKPGVPLRAPGTGTSTNATPSGPSTTPGQQPPRLARTGSDNQNLAIGGLVAIILGGSILFIARRRVPVRSKRH